MLTVTVTENRGDLLGQHFGDQINEVRAAWRAHLQRTAIDDDARPGLTPPRIHTGWEEPGQRNSVIGDRVISVEHRASRYGRHIVDREFDGRQAIGPSSFDLRDRVHHDLIEHVRSGAEARNL